MPSYSTYAGELAPWVDKYTKLGRNEAAENRPPSNATSPDFNEESLRAETSKWMASEQHLFDSLITEASRTLTDIRQKLTDLEVRIDQLLSDRALQSGIDADLQGEKAQLIEAAVKRLGAERDYRFFREENSIRELPSYPESRVMHVAVVFALAFAEMFINAFFYENEQGLVGGFVVAAAISGVMMLGSVMLGRGFTYKNLAAMNNKVAGWACLLVFVVASLWLNAVFAAFRGEYQMLADTTDYMMLRRAFRMSVTEANQLFILSMRFSDLYSMILFAVGFILSCLAFYKGYTYDDKYPGHGSKDRQLKKLIKIEAAQRTLTLQKVKDILQRRRSEIDAAAHEPGLLMGKVAGRIAELQHSQKQVTIQAKAIQADCDRALRAYRGANVAVRAVEKPAYFDDYPNMTSLVNPQAAEEILSELAIAQDQIKRLREHHKDTINEKMHALAHESASILNKTFSDFLNAVERDAQDIIDRTAQPVHAAVRR